MLGSRIAALRRDAGMSQAELAKRLKVSPSAVGMYEQGRREPSAETLVALSQEFQVSTDYLLTGTPRSPSDEHTLSRMLLDALNRTDERMAERNPRPFSKQELASLIAAMLLEP